MPACSSWTPRWCSWARRLLARLRSSRACCTTPTAAEASRPAASALSALRRWATRVAGRRRWTGFCSSPAATARRPADVCRGREAGAGGGMGLPWQAGVSAGHDTIHSWRSRGGDLFRCHANGELVGRAAVGECKQTADVGVGACSRHAAQHRHAGLLLLTQAREARALEPAARLYLVACKIDLLQEDTAVVTQGGAPPVEELELAVRRDDFAAYARGIQATAVAVSAKTGASYRRASTRRNVGRRCVTSASDSAEPSALCRPRRAGTF